MARGRNKSARSRRKPSGRPLKKGARGKKMLTGGTACGGPGKPPCGGRPKPNRGGRRKMAVGGPGRTKTSRVRPGGAEMGNRIPCIAMPQHENNPASCNSDGSCTWCKMTRKCINTSEWSAAACAGASQGPTQNRRGGKTRPTPRGRGRKMPHGGSSAGVSGQCRTDNQCGAGQVCSGGMCRSQNPPGSKPWPSKARNQRNGGITRPTRAVGGTAATAGSRLTESPCQSDQECGTGQCCDVPQCGHPGCCVEACNDGSKPWSKKRLKPAQRRRGGKTRPVPRGKKMAQGRKVRPGVSPNPGPRSKSNQRPHIGRVGQTPGSKPCPLGQHKDALGRCRSIGS